MIPRQTEADILRLFHGERWKVGTIARQLGVHHTTVQRVLAQAGIPSQRLLSRPTMADPFVPFIVETLEKYPTLRATRLYDMVRERGYPGKPDHFRSVVARYRPRPAPQAYLRLRTLPGEQAQVDWGHFGKVAVGRARRQLMGFVMVLSYSRQIFLRFFYGAKMACFLRGHVGAFESFGGVPRVLLYDNLRSAVAERVGDAIRFHPTLLDLAAHYRYEPRPVAVARGNEKGRVERAIRFIRDRFFAAREFGDLADLNAQAEHWAATTAAQRPCPEQSERTVAEVFAEERALLRELPADPFPAEDHAQVHVGRTPYVRFDLNDYSVPHTLVRRTLAVHATLETVRVLDADRVIATHPRCWDKGEQVENPEHIEALVECKRASRKHRGIDRLHHATTHGQALMRLLAERGHNLGSATRQLLGLLDRFGTEALDSAILEAIEGNSPNPASVRQILDQRHTARGLPPPIAVTVPDDPRLTQIAVRPHSLATYDSLADSEDNESNQNTTPPTDRNQGRCHCLADRNQGRFHRTADQQG